MASWRSLATVFLIGLGMLMAPVGPATAAVDPPTGIDLVVAIDQSGSMWGHPRLHPTQNDAWQHRIGATHEIVLRLLDDVWESPRVHRFSIIEFGDQAEVVWSAHELRYDPKDPERVRRETLPWLERRIQAHDLINTNTPAAMELAASELEKMRKLVPLAGRRQVVLIITDGRAALPNARPAEMRTRIRQRGDRLSNLGAEIWLVGLNDADRYWLDGDGAFWEEIAGDVNRARLAAGASTALPSIVYDMVDDWLGVTGAQLVDSEYLCPPYMSRLAFTVNFGKPRGTIRILDPDGLAVPRSAGGGHTRPGTYAHFSLDDPKPGLYTIDKEPGRHQVIRASATPAGLDLLLPAGAADLDTTTAILLQAKRSAGKPIDLLPAYPVEVMILITAPSGKAARLSAEMDDDGKVEAEFCFAESGTYQLLINGLVTLTDGSRADVFAGSTSGAKHTIEVSDRRPLWLVPHSFRPDRGIAAPPWATEAELDFELAVADLGPVDDLEQVVREPAAWLQLLPLDPSGVAIGPPIRMTVTAPARFSATVPLDLNWNRAPGLTGLGQVQLRVLAEPGRLTGEHYLKAIRLEPGFEHLRVGSDPLTLGPIAVRLPWWLRGLALVPVLALLALTAWLFMTRLLPSLAIRRRDRARGRNVQLKIYDLVSDPTGASAKVFPAGGKRCQRLDRKVMIEVKGTTVIAERCRLTRLVRPGKARARLEYRWGKGEKTHAVLLTAGNYAALKGLPEHGSRTVAMLTEGP